MNAGAEDEIPPVYALRFSAYGERNLIDAVLYMGDASGKTEPEAGQYARAFERGLRDAIGRLATFPLRFPVASEAGRLKPPPVHAMPYLHRSGGPVWRVLFRVLEADGNEAPRVEIIAVRHGSQKPMTQAEAKEIDTIRD